MCLRNTKKHSLYWLLCSILLVSLLFGQLNLGVYASESEPTPTVAPEYSVQYVTEHYIRDNFRAICRYVVKWNAIISDGIIGTWDDFTSWLDSSGNGDIWTQHPHTPMRINGDVEVPEEVLDVVNQYVIYRIEANPLTYTDCTISSYNFLDPTRFPNYNMYKAVKDYMGSTEGYHIIQYIGTYGSSITEVRVATLSHDLNLGFVGTTSNGIFTQVKIYKDWSINFTVANCPRFNSSGSVIDRTSQNVNNYNLHNGTSLELGYIFTSYPKNEHVYVFNNLNAYKNFNTGTPQQYYLTTDGIGTSMSNWEVGSGTINTGTLSSANNTYNNVVNNVQTGWTADQVLALVDKISGSSGNGSGSDDDDDNPFSFLGDIGDLIKDLVTGVGDLLTDLVGSLVDVVLGTKQEDGTRSGGIIGLITDILSSLTGLINTNIGDFLSAVFSWLPTEFVTIFKAMLIFGIFFSIWKLIRG